MAKLSHKITNDNNEEPKLKTTIKLSTKSGNLQQNQPEKDKKITEKIADFPQIQNTDGLIEFLEQLFSQDFFRKFNKEQFVYDFQNNEISPKEKLKIILSDFISAEELKKINVYQQKKESEKKELQEKIQQLENQIVKLKKVIDNLKNQLNEAEEETFKTKQKYAKVFPAEDLIKIITEIDEDRNLERIAELFKQNFNSSDKISSKFVLLFTGGLKMISATIETFGTNEKNNMEQLDFQLGTFMKTLKGLHPPFRRDALNYLAEYVNKFFNTYKFVSPEATLQIDPNIHNAEGIGGTLVKEGLSFAIVRKDTGKTVKLADIITTV